MHNLDLEKAEEPDIKFPMSIGSKGKQGHSRKTSTSASLTALKPLTVWITTNWKILKGMAIPDYITCVLRNLYAGQEAIVRTKHGTTDWFQILKGVQFSSVIQLCLTLCNPMNHSTPGLPIYHQLLESTQTHVFELMMPSNYIILCRPFLLLPSIFPSIRLFSNESALCIRWPNY